MRALAHALAAALLFTTLLLPSTVASVGIPMEAMNVGTPPQARQWSRDADWMERALEARVVPTIPRDFSREMELAEAARSASRWDAETMSRLQRADRPVPRIPDTSRIILSGDGLR